MAAATGTSETAAKTAITAVFEQIAIAAAKGEDVSVPGFGKFAVKDRPERQGRNPATGEAMTIAASRKLSFTAAMGLKDKLRFHQDALALLVTPTTPTLRPRQYRHPRHGRYGRPYVRL